VVLGAFFRSADEVRKSDVITDSLLVIAVSCNAKSMILDFSLRSILYERKYNLSLCHVLAIVSELSIPCRI
jgi:hypothetical protein